MQYCGPERKRGGKRREEEEERGGRGKRRKEEREERKEKEIISECLTSHMTNDDIIVWTSFPGYMIHGRV